MAYHIYTTDAFVIESSGIGEANRYFLLFTRELGMIKASAQGVRHVQSKLRGNLSDFSRATVSLVRGKNGWKITSAVAEYNFYTEFEAHRKALLLGANAFSVLKRLLHGEEKNERLFSLVAEGFDFLRNHAVLPASAAERFSSEDISTIECLLVLNILHALGYVSVPAELSGMIASEQPAIPSIQWNEDLLARVSPLREKAIIEINRSLKESQL